MPSRKYVIPECKQMNSADFAATYVTGSSLSDFQNVHADLTIDEG